MNEQIKIKILKAIEDIKFGTIIVQVRAGKVIDISVQTSLDLREKIVDKVNF